MHACMHGACIRQCTCRLSVKNLIGYACACGERVCACACACLSVWGLDEQIFASPARAFWRQQLQEFLDKGCKYEIEALNAVHHVGSDPLGFLSGTFIHDKICRKDYWQDDLGPMQDD